MPTSLWESKRHVFVVDHKIVTTPYPFPPPHDICSMGLAQRNPDPSTTHFTRWSDNRFPTLAWVPSCPRFDSKPFTVLKKRNDGYGIREVNCRYMLGQQVIDEWTTLQKNLRFIAEALFNKSNYARLPSEFALFPLPDKYGFQRDHESREAARIVGDSSRLAFGPLMGWISYLLTQHCHEKNGVPWWRHLLKQAGVPDDSLTELSNSELFDFSPCYRRAGVVMTQSCQFKWMASLMYQNHIPFWIEWTSDTSLDGLRSEFHFLQPTPGEVEVAREAAREVNPTPTLPEEPAWKAWLKKQEERRPIRLAKETPERMRSRLSREKQAKKYILSSTAEVYWWDDTGMEGRVRTLLPRGEANHVWGAYSNVQRIYNGFTNEWDICTDFGDDPTGIDSDGDSTEDEIPYDEGPIDNEDSMDVGPPSAPSAPQREAADPVPMAIESSSAVRFKAANQDPIPIENSMDIGPPSACSSLHLGAIDQDPKAAEPSAPPLETASQDLTTIENPVDTEAPIEGSLPPLSPLSHTPASVPTSTPAQHQWIDTLSADYGHPVESTRFTFSWTFTDALYERYGFLDLSDTVNIPFPEKDWNFITHTFGHPSSTEKTNALHRALSLFLSNMLSKTAPPGFIWDIGELCDMPLAEASQDSPFRVLPITVEGCHHYVVSSKAVSTVPWVLEFRDPATVLQCFRRQETTIPELAQFLSHYGAAFTTRLRGSQIATSLGPRHRRQVELGWRMPLHRGTALEYNFYVESRNQLLHRPHGRAALLEGGIIWRLAVDGLGSLSESLVLDGPSLDVLQYGHAVKCGSDKQHWLWDDALSDQDRDTICGVYKVYTSQFFSHRLS